MAFEKKSAIEENFYFNKRPYNEGDYQVTIFLNMLKLIKKAENLLSTFLKKLGFLAKPTQFNNLIFNEGY